MNNWQVGVLIGCRRNNANDDELVATQKHTAGAQEQTLKLSQAQVIKTRILKTVSVPLMRARCQMCASVTRTRAIATTGVNLLDLQQQQQQQQLQQLPKQHESGPLSRLVNKLLLTLGTSRSHHKTYKTHKQQQPIYETIVARLRNCYCALANSSQLARRVSQVCRLNAMQALQRRQAAAAMLLLAALLTSGLLLAALVNLGQCNPLPLSASTSPSTSPSTSTSLSSSSASAQQEDAPHLKPLHTLKDNFHQEEFQQQQQQQQEALLVMLASDESLTSAIRRLVKRSGISDQRLAEIQMLRALKKQLERAKVGANSEPDSGGGGGQSVANGQNTS